MSNTTTRDYFDSADYRTREQRENQYAQHVLDGMGTGHTIATMTGDEYRRVMASLDRARRARLI